MAAWLFHLEAQLLSDHGPTQEPQWLYIAYWKEKYYVM